MLESEVMGTYIESKMTDLPRKNPQIPDLFIISLQFMCFSFTNFIRELKMIFNTIKL